MYGLIQLLANSNVFAQKKLLSKTTGTKWSNAECRSLDSSQVFTGSTCQTVIHSLIEYLLLLMLDRLK